MIRSEDSSRQKQAFAQAETLLAANDPALTAATLLAWVEASRDARMPAEALAIIDKGCPLALTRENDPERFLRVARLLAHKAAILLEQGRKDEALAALKKSAALTDPADAVCGISHVGMADALVRAGLADETLALADQAILRLIDHGHLSGMSDIMQIETVLELRTRVLLAAGRPGEALATAKSLYNVSSSKNLPNATALIGQCLEAVNPGKPAPAERPPGKIAETAPDAALYERALSSGGIPPFLADDYAKLSRGGYLLLLSGHPREAKAWLARARDVCPAERIAVAEESLLRATRAASEIP